MESSTPPDSLSELLTLEELDTNLYRAQNPPDEGRRRLYGGQVAAQSLAAAAVTVTVESDRLPHSLHGFFLRGGRTDRPTIMAVDRDRDGGSFSARHVNAIQDGKVIFSALASFQVQKEGIDRQMPTLASDAVTRACVLTYVSDLGWAFAGMHEDGAPLAGPSLDHAVWLQRPVDITEWLFVQLTPVSVAATRGVFTGTIHTRSGVLAAFIAQEALLRPQE